MSPCREYLCRWKCGIRIFTLGRFCCGGSSGSPDGVRVGIVASDGGDDTARFLTLSDGHLVVTLRQNRTLVHVVDIDGDGRRRGGSVPAAYQSHRILGAEHEDVLTLPLKIQDLGKSGKFSHVLEFRNI